MWIGYAFLALRVCGLLFILFDGQTEYHLYPLDPTDGREEILQTWQSWVFLLVTNATLVFMSYLLAFRKLDAQQTKIVQVDFMLRCGEWLDELVTGSRPYIGEVISYNTISVGLFSVFLLALRWKYSRS